MLKVLKTFLLSAPPDVIVWKIWCKLLNVKISDTGKWQDLFINKKGIEIGGPSPIFTKSGFLPLYSVVKELDGVNFGVKTVWEGELAEGMNFRFEDKTGYQYIAEGSDLPKVKSNSYDFVISCNNLEHIANPVKAIYEWKRIIQTGGSILLVLPNKKSNFDHRRPYTELQHLIADYESNIPEDDLTHLGEVLQLHDLRRDWLAGTYDQFKKRSEDNIHNRCLHHHVFSLEVLKGMLEYTGLKVLLQYSSKTDHYIIAENTGS